MKNIYTIILHIGDTAVTKKCLKSFLQHEKKYKQIIVVNNDARLLSAKDFGQKNILVLNNKKNLGFAKGVNVGIRYALGLHADAILLLNNDIQVKKTFISILLQTLEDYKNIGIVGPAIAFLKNKKTVYDIGGSIDMLTGKTSHQEVEKVENKNILFPQYITGAVMFIRKEVFEKIGFFDEDFFLYYEDADFCLRARMAGFLIGVNPSLSLHHLLSKTIGKLTPFAVFYQTQSALIFGKKYMHSPIQKLLHMSFIVFQTTLITCKHPLAGITGWKAIFGITKNVTIQL